MPKVRKIQPPPDWDDDANDQDDNAEEQDDDEDYEDEEYEDEDSGDYSFGGWYPPSSPIRTDKGIKARSQRGAFGTSWWAKRWIAALDRFGWGSRLQRGKTYARQGQVLTIDFAGAKIKAKVQGSRPKPYDVTIEMQPLSAAQWAQVIDALARQAIFAAKLLAGEMPQNIEQAFDAAGVPLFPRGPQDISASCSCPDYANPCKHIAAVYYLLGERFDEDPFLIFQARGRTREQIIDALRALRAGASEDAAPIEHAPAEPTPALADLLATFYQAGSELDTIQAHIAAPEIEAATLKRYGPAPADTDADLRVIYRAITARVLERVLGEEE
jgi:uncharacterized Zn finger protein